MDVCYQLDKIMKLWIYFLSVTIILVLFMHVIILISSTTTSVYVTMSKFLVTRVEIPCKVLTNKMLKTKNYCLLLKNLLAKYHMLFNCTTQFIVESLKIEHFYMLATCFRTHKGVQISRSQKFFLDLNSLPNLHF
jgi:hypothetical protein